MLLASDLSSVVTVRTPYEIWRLPPLSGLDDGQDGRGGVGWQHDASTAQTGLRPVHRSSRCYLKCYLKCTLNGFRRQMLVRFRRLLPAIAGLSDGHAGSSGIANPVSRN